MSTPAHLTVPRRPSFWRRHIVSVVAHRDVHDRCAASRSRSAAAAEPHHPAPLPAGPVQSGPVAVSIQNFAFSPASLTVKVGAVVTWTNVDSEAHTVRTTATDALRSGVLDTNGTFTYTFRTAARSRTTARSIPRCKPPSPSSAEEPHEHQPLRHPANDPLRPTPSAAAGSCRTWRGPARPSSSPPPAECSPRAPAPASRPRRRRRRRSPAT